MKILVRDNLPTAIVNRFQSSSVIVPVRSRLESTFPELQIIRVANWSAPSQVRKCRQYNYLHVSLPFEQC